MWRFLSFAQQAGLLGPGTERRLATRVLVSVGLQHTLEGLGGRATAVAATGHFTSQGGLDNSSSRRGGVGHFVLR